MLQCFTKAVLSGSFLFLILCGTSDKLSAQEDFRPALTKFTTNFESPDLPQSRPLDSRSFLLLLGAQIRETELDCSHFVQYLYEQAGLYYDYVPSRILYDGMEGFTRVLHPQPGDLIVWRGHMGVVVDPEETTFLSALRSGVKTSSYQSHYWKQRGRPRFFHFVGTHDNVPAEWTARKSLSPRASSSGE